MNLFLSVCFSQKWEDISNLQRDPEMDFWLQVLLVDLEFTIILQSKITFRLFLNKLLVITS